MDPLQPDEKGRLPLHDAIRRGDVAQITTWLQGGMNPNARLRDEEPTPIQMAIENKNIDLVRLFTAYDADLLIDTPAGKGKNAYHYAALSTPEIMKHLLEQPQRAGAEYFYRESARMGREFRNVSPLRIALRAGDREMTELLLDYGINVNERDDNGETPLHFLLGNRTSREEALPLVHLLLERGADTGAKAWNYWDESPLFPAVRDQFTEAVALLLDLGGNAAEKNHQGETLLMEAAETYDAKTVRLLLDHGAKLEEKNRIGRTALHIAAHANRLDVVKTLLAAGADPFVRDNSGKTPDQICLSDLQKNVHAEILRKQMELDAKHATQPRGGYYDRRRQMQQQQHSPPGRNRSSRHWQNKP